MAQQTIGTSRQAQRTAGAATNANFTELFARHIRVDLPAVTANTTFVLPAGYMIEHFAFQNTTANAVTGGVKVGTTSGGTDSLAAQAIAANTLDTTPGAGFTKRIFSTTADTTMYLQAVTAWNNASVNFSIVLRRLFV